MDRGNGRIVRAEGEARCVEGYIEGYIEDSLQNNVVIPIRIQGGPLAAAQVRKPVVLFCTSSLGLGVWCLRVHFCFK